MSILRFAAMAILPSPRTTGSRASSSRAGAASSSIWPFWNSFLRLEYSTASSKSLLTRASTPARLPPPASLLPPVRSRTTAAFRLDDQVLDPIAQEIHRDRLTGKKPSARASSSAPVTPPVRAMGIVNAAGSMPSAGLKEGLISPSTRPSPNPLSPATPESRVGVGMEEPGGDPLPGGVDASGIAGDGDVRAHGDDPPITNEDGPIGNPRSGDRIDRSAGDGDGLTLTRQRGGKEQPA